VYLVGYSLFYRSLLQKRRILLRSLLNAKPHIMCTLLNIDEGVLLNIDESVLCTLLDIDEGIMYSLMEEIRLQIFGSRDLTVLP